MTPVCTGRGAMSRAQLSERDAWAEFDVRAQVPLGPRHVWRYDGSATTISIDARQQVLAVAMTTTVLAIYPLLSYNRHSVLTLLQ
jgi:hypothetical protein